MSPHINLFTLEKLSLTSYWLLTAHICPMLRELDNNPDQVTRSQGNWDRTVLDSRLIIYKKFYHLLLRQLDNLKPNKLRLQTGLYFTLVLTDKQEQLWAGRPRMMAVTKSSQTAPGWHLLIVLRKSVPAHTSSARGGPVTLLSSDWQSQPNSHYQTTDWELYQIFMEVLACHILNVSVHYN